MPEVHAAYDERCYFFLIAGRDPQRRSTFTEELDNLLDRIDIESRLVHVVYGQYDALVRIWATESARQRFLRELHDGGLQIDGFVEFAADVVSYKFGSVQSLPEDLTLSEGQRADVARVVRAEHEGDYDDDAVVALARLQVANLVLEVPPVAGVKLYMFFHPSGVNLAQPRDRTIVALAQEASSAGLQEVSLYGGVGFAQFLLKAWSSTYDGTLEAVNAVRRTAKDLQLSPWTLLVADGAKSIGETIDSVQSELPRALEDFIGDAKALPSDLQHALRRELASVPPSDRDVITARYREARELLSPSDVQRFVEIVAASVVGDRKIFNRSLSYLASIEEDLRWVLPRLLQAHLGPAWLERVDEMGWTQRTSSDPGDDEDLPGVQGLSLALLLRLLRRSSEEIDVVREGTSDLPSNWHKQIRSLLQLRNRFVHGSLWEYARQREFGARWGDYLPVLITSISLQTSLEDWAKSLT
jgi:hypothetical protein